MHHLKRRLQNISIIGALSVLGLQAATLANEEKNIHLQTLAKRFLSGKELWAYCIDVDTTAKKKKLLSY